MNGIFVAIGHAPKNELFAELVELDEAGFIKAGEDCLTKTPGVFAAGDCRTKEVRQLTTRRCGRRGGGACSGEILQK